MLGDASDAWLPMALQEEIRPPSAGPLRRRLGGLSMLGARDVRWLSMIGRLRDGLPETIETSALHLDVLRDLKRINAHLTTVAYPILEETGELRGSRLRARQSAPEDPLSKKRRARA